MMWTRHPIPNGGRVFGRGFKFHRFPCGSLCFKQLARKINPPSADSRPMVANLDTARAQAWNQRIAWLLPELNPVSLKVCMRTEFSGVGTAEEAMTSAAVLFNQKPCTTTPVQVEVESISDWSTAALKFAEVNHSTACRFGDIMGLVPARLKSKLEEKLEEKAQLVGLSV